MKCVLAHVIVISECAMHSVWGPPPTTVDLLGAAHVYIFLLLQLSELISAISEKPGFGSKLI